MARSFAVASATLLVCAGTAAPAFAHSAFLGSDPEPGTSLARSPGQISLTFTEPLNERLSRAKLFRVADGKEVTDVAGSASGRRLLVRPGRRLERGAYTVRWHTASTDDGHTLEGSFSFGVRARAAGAEHDVEQNPFARSGWRRVLARSSMYGTLLVFCGALLLDALLSRRGQWLTPAPLDEAAPGLDLERVAARYRLVVLGLGLMAAGAAAVSAGADAADAAGGLSARGLGDFLLYNLAGLSRLAVVSLVVLALALFWLRARSAALAAAGGLLAVALSGHAAAASPRSLAVIDDWAHLTATALWAGGISLIVLVWGPRLRRSAQPERLAVMRHVIAVFGRVALPAFVIVVLTGLIGATIELGRVPALWQTDYGRVLTVKVGLVALIAAASCQHALRLRPRLLAADSYPDERLECRHWRLWRAEPLLALGVIAAAALLAAFPLPPRQLRAADAPAARASACDPCPLPGPTLGELAVAERAGADLVAAWLRRAGDGLTGTIRIYSLKGLPADDPFTIVGARQASCGRGCLRFDLARASSTITVQVRQNGQDHRARLPARWQPRQRRRAQRLVIAAQRAMRGLRSVREVERASSIPGLYATTTYRLEAPDRMAFRTNAGVRNVVIGARQWMQGQPGLPWRRGEYGAGLAFRSRSWFTWTTYARHVFLLRERLTGGRRVAVVALMDPGTPAWWQLTIDLRTRRVLHDRLVTYGHFMTQRFFAFNQPLLIEPPRSLDGG